MVSSCEFALAAIICKVHYTLHFDAEYAIFTMQFESALLYEAFRSTCRMRIVPDAVLACRHPRVRELGQP